MIKVRNINNKVLQVQLIILLILCFFFGDVVSKELDKPDKFTPSRFWGEWKTKEGISPKIYISFHKNGYEITINDKPIEMKYSMLSSFTTHRFFQFQKEYTGPYGGWSYRELALVSGYISSERVLSGFYTELDHDKLDEIIRNFDVPVVLYRLNR
ncbi:MAG: hypothetical protein OEV42_15640 [Deltaproteobacteria bacterium]|nr:hypothetical protein [Deltaproteobacteria bacterium]